MIIIFFFLYSVLSYTFVIHGENTTTIEQDSILSSKFSQTNPIQTQCSPIRLYIVGSTQNQSEFIVKNNNETDLHFQFNITSVDNDIISVHHNKQLEQITIKPNNSFEFHVNYIVNSLFLIQYFLQLLFYFQYTQKIFKYKSFINVIGQQNQENQKQIRSKKFISIWEIIMIIFNYILKYEYVLITSLINHQAKKLLVIILYISNLFNNKITSTHLKYWLNNICLKEIGEQTWTTIQIIYQFNENQHIAYYYKLCGASETFFHPLAVLLFFSLCIIVSGSIYGIKEWKLFGGAQTEAYGPKAAIIFIIVSSFLLISLYKFQTFASSFTYIIMMFTAFISLETILLDMQSEYSYSNNIKILFSTIMSGTLITLYHHTKTWILNNILAVSIIFFSFRILEFDSLKTGTIFMLLALLYDMFWIFVSPTIFGQSVIQNITTTIELPIKLLSPSLIKNCTAAENKFTHIYHFNSKTKGQTTKYKNKKLRGCSVIPLINNVQFQELAIFQLQD